MAASSPFCRFGSDSDDSKYPTPEELSDYINLESDDDLSQEFEGVSLTDHYTENPGRYCIYENNLSAAKYEAAIPGTNPDNITNQRDEESAAAPEPVPSPATPVTLPTLWFGYERPIVEAEFELPPPISHKPPKQIFEFAYEGHLPREADLRVAKDPDLILVLETLTPDGSMIENRFSVLISSYILDQAFAEGYYEEPAGLPSREMYEGIEKSLPENHVIALRISSNIHHDRWVSILRYIHFESREPFNKPIPEEEMIDWAIDMAVIADRFALLNALRHFVIPAIHQMDVQRDGLGFEDMMIYVTSVFEELVEPGVVEKFLRDEWSLEVSAVSECGSYVLRKGREVDIRLWPESRRGE